MRVIVCVPLVLPSGCGEKVNCAGANEIVGTTPVPLKGVTCGTDPAESLTESDPVCVPAAAGEKMMLTLHELLAASDAGQLFV